jgi:hypothetical protein
LPDGLVSFPFARRLLQKTLKTNGLQSKTYENE